MVETTKRRVPPPPKSLGVRGRATWRALWRRFVFEDQRELDLMVEFCRCLDRIEAYQELLDADGLVVEGRYGPKEHPAALAQRAERALLVKLGAQLDLPGESSGWDGLTASDRARKAAHARWTRGAAL